MCGGHKTGTNQVVVTVVALRRQGRHTFDFSNETDWTSELPFYLKRGPARTWDLMCHLQTTEHVRKGTRCGLAGRSTNFSGSRRTTGSAQAKYPLRNTKSHLVTVTCCWHGQRFHRYSLGYLDHWLAIENIIITKWKHTSNKTYNWWLNYFLTKLCSCFFLLPPRFPSLLQCTLEVSLTWNMLLIIVSLCFLLGRGKTLYSREHRENAAVNSTLSVLSLLLSIRRGSGNNNTEKCVQIYYICTYLLGKKRTKK